MYIQRPIKTVSTLLLSSNLLLNTIASAIASPPSPSPGLLSQGLLSQGLTTDTAKNRDPSEQSLVEEALPGEVLLGEVLPGETLPEERLSEGALIEKALAIAESVENPNLKSLTLAGIASAYARQGDLESAKTLLALALQIEDSNTDSADAKVLHRLAIVYFETGEKEKAVELLSRALNALGTIRSRTPNYTVFLETVKRYGEFGEAALVSAGLDQAVQVAAEIDSEFRRHYAFGKIAIAYGNLDDPEIATAGIAKMAQRLESAGSERSRFALVDIAAALAKQGDSNGAIARLNQVIQPDSTYLMDDAATIYASLNDTALAKTALDELSVMVQTLKDSENQVLEDRVRVINTIAIAYITLDAPESAQQFLDAALPSQSELEQSTVAIYLLSQLADTYAQLGDISTQQALLQRTFELFVPTDLPEPNQLGAWQAIIFPLMSQNYVKLQDDVAAEKLAVLRQVAVDHNWDWTYPTYLSTLTQAAHERGNTELIGQILDRITTVVNASTDGAASGRDVPAAQIKTLTQLAGTYEQISNVPVAISYLQTLTITADSLTESTQKQTLLAAIALAYAELS